VIAEPPLLDGAAQARLTPLALWGAAVRFWGAPGTVRGVAERVFDGEPVPAPFVALTLNVYDVPFVRPLIAHVVAPPVVQVAPPGLAVAVYPVIGLPPFEAGADHERLT
jgi:hypothetical protein